MAAFAVTTEASEQRYRTLVDNLQDGIWTIDTSGNTVFANPGMARLLGTTVEQMIGRPSFEYVFEEDAARAGELFRKKIEGDGEPFEFRIRRSDGSSFWALVSGMPLYDSGGHTIGLLGTFHDITDRKLAEDVSARHSQELARSNAELQQFSYLISHDLREPIRTMRAYAELLQGRYRGKLDREADTFLGFIASGAERMDKLLNNLLSYSRVAARHEDAVEHVELKNALEWAIRNLDIAIKEARAEIQCDELPPVLGNELQLAELFQNLLSNAIKYRRSGEPARVHISAQLNSDDLIVAVRDHGIGIAKDQQAQVFFPFKRLHGLEIPGTGMGLAICHKIVQNHGGRIWVESEPGQGSTFFFTLRHGHHQDRKAGCIVAAT